jgi:hypothetical protein
VRRSAVNGPDVLTQETVEGQATVTRAECRGRSQQWQELNRHARAEYVSESG